MSWIAATLFQTGQSFMQIDKNSQAAMDWCTAGARAAKVAGLAWADTVSSSTLSLSGSRIGVVEMLMDRVGGQMFPDYEVSEGEGKPEVEAGPMGGGEGQVDGGEEGAYMHANG